MRLRPRTTLPGFSPKQQTDPILRLLDLLLYARDGLRRRLHQLFGLPQVEQSRDAALSVATWSARATARASAEYVCEISSA